MYYASHSMVPGGTSAVDGWARQLRKGVLDLAILAHLKAGPVHGYALIQRLKVDGLMAAGGAEATVYQALQRLSKSGLASATWSAPAESERPRKMYHLTPAGKKAYQAMTTEWHALRDAIEQLQVQA